MARDDDAGRGVELGQKAVHALADEQDGEALAILQSGTHAETAWAAAYLLAGLREASLAMHRGNARKARRYLHTAANVTEDALMTRVQVLLHEAEKEIGHG